MVSVVGSLITEEWKILHLFRNDMSVVHPHLGLVVREDHTGLHGDLGGPPHWQLEAVLQEPLELQQVHRVPGSRHEQVIPLEWGPSS